MRLSIAMPRVVRCLWPAEPGSTSAPDAVPEDELRAIAAMCAAMGAPLVVPRRRRRQD